MTVVLLGIIIIYSWKVNKGKKEINPSVIIKENLENQDLKFKEIENRLVEAGADLNSTPPSFKDVESKLKAVGANLDSSPLKPEDVEKSINEAISK